MDIDSCFYGYSEGLNTMARRRFDDLEAAIDGLRNPTTGAFNRANVPAGTVLDNYLKFKTGETVITVTRDPASLPGKLVTKQLIAFGGAVADAPIFVPVSNRAITALGSLSVSAIDLNLDDVDATGQKKDGFIPAKVTVFKFGAQVATKVDSQITGRKYNPREGASYTYPFGQKSGGTGADVTYRGVAAGIRASLDETTESVSFKEEDYPV